MLFETLSIKNAKHEMSCFVYFFQVLYYLFVYEQTMYTFALKILLVINMNRITNTLKQTLKLIETRSMLRMKILIASILSIAFSFSAQAGNVTVNLTSSSGGTLSGAYYIVSGSTTHLSSGSTMSLTTGNSYTLYAVYSGTRSSVTTFVSSAGGNTFAFQTTNVTFHFSGSSLRFESSNNGNDDNDDNNENGGFANFSKTNGVWNSHELFPNNSAGQPITIHTGSNSDEEENGGINFSIDFNGLTSIEKTIAVLRVLNSSGNPIAGVTFTGGTTSSADAWNVSGTTNSDGLLLEITDGNGTSLAYKATLNGNSSVIGPQNANTNSYFLFHTYQLTLRLLSSTGAPLSGGTAKWGYGSTADTYNFPAPNSTNASGKTVTEFFAGTYSFEMSYNGTHQAKTSIAVPSTNTGSGHENDEDYEGEDEHGNQNQTITWSTIKLTLKLQSSTSAPLSGGTAQWGDDSTPNSYTFPAPNSTNASGLTSAEFFPGTYSFEMTYNGTSKNKISEVIPNANTTLTWTTMSLTLKLTTCTGANLSGGTAKWGHGSSATTSNFPSPNSTNSSGATSAEFFPGTYSFEMSYQNTTEIKSSIVVSDVSTTLTWVTANIAYNPSFNISYGGSGDDATFNKPEMELLPGNVWFNFKKESGDEHELVTLLILKPVSVSITASPAGAICAGTSVTFTATPTYGGSSPSYVWKKNGTEVGTNSATYTDASLANADVITCVLTSNLSCITGNPATADAITETVNALNPVSVSIEASPAGAICLGTSVTFTATPIHGGETPSFLWKKNGTEVGTNSATYTDATLANSDVITCVLTSNIICATGNPATSEAITETIKTYYTITASSGSNGSISPSGVASICSGNNQSYTISAAADYHILDVLVDGVSQGAIESYLFENVTSNHTISCTFAPNCVAPAIVSDATTTPVTCIGSTNGSITTNVSGTETLIYSWSNGASTANLTGVPAGTYTYTVTNNCGVISGSATVGQPEAPSSAITGSSTVLGALQTTYSGPTGLSTYSWSKSGSGASIVGSTTGSSVVVLTSCSTTTFTLTLVVTNANGCSSTTTKTVTVLPSATITVYSSLYSTGTGNHPSVTKSALAASLKVFERGSAGRRDGNQSHYSTLWNGTNYLVANVSISGPVTVSVGGGPSYKYTIRVPANGHYLIIGQSTVASTKCGGSTCTIYTGRKIGGHEDVDGNSNDRDDDNDDNLTACSNTKLRYHTVMKDQTGKCTEGDVHEEHGSLMMIVAPMTIEFTDSISYLPIVYESVVGDWSVSAGAEPPCGFYTYPATELSANVTDSVLNAIQFAVIDTGSEWTFTAVTHKIQHNGLERIAFSNPIMVNNRTNKPTTLNIYPNPALDQVKVVMPNFEGKATLYIYNIFGLKVSEQPINLISGASVTLNVSSLAQGVYLVSAVNGYGKATSRLIKVDK